MSEHTAPTRSRGPAHRRRRLAASLAVAWVVLPWIALAETPGADGTVEASAASRWAFEFAPYLWLPAVHGTTRIGDETAPVDVGFSKLFDLLGDGDLLAGGGHFEVGYDRRFSFFLDAFGGTARPSSDVTFGPRGRLSGVADLTMNWAFFEFGPAVRVVDWAGDPGARPIEVDVLAGGRLMYFYEKIALRGEGRTGFERIDSASTTWVDPFVGGRFSVPAGPIDILFRGDIGGFGAGSELAWNLIGGIGVELPWRPGASRTSLVLIYKALSFDYETGSGSDLRRFDLEFRGPALGLQFAF